MAPKVMKRPASARTYGQEVKRSAMKSWLLSTAQYQGIIHAIEGVEGVPTCVHNLLLQLRGRSPSLQGHGKAIKALGEILDGIDDSLQNLVVELQRKLDKTDEEKQQRIEARAEAESRIAEMKQTIAEKKAAIDRSTRDIDVAQQALQDGRSGKQHAGSEVKLLMRKKERLENAHKSFVPLKHMQAKAGNGQNHLKTLRKVGKQFGFHEVLLDSVSAVLRKQPDRRQTFDNLTVQQFEKELAKHVGKVQTAVQEGEVSITENVASMQAAQETLINARKAHQTSVREVAEAEEALKDRTSVLNAAKQHLKELPSDTKKTLHDLKRAKDQLNTFRAGPRAAFEKLWFRAQSQQTTNEKTESIQEGVASAAAKVTWSVAESQACNTFGKVSPARQVSAENPMALEAAAVVTPIDQKACKIFAELAPPLGIPAEAPMPLEATATIREAPAELCMKAVLSPESQLSPDCSANKNERDRDCKMLFLGF